jgi:lambda family phage tail tape measure protein
MAANNIARLGVVLGLDSAEFVRGLDAANKKLYDFGVKVAEQGKIAVAALGTAFVAATFEAMKFADEIADVAKANDVAIDTIIKLNDALANSGGKAEDSGKLLAGFTKFVDGAATGSFEAQQALGKMGVSLNDIANLSTEDLFKRVVQAVSEIEDPLTRNARAMDIFGKAAKGVDFVGVAEEMDKVNVMTEYQAQAIRDAADAFDMFNQHARDVKFTMATEIGTSLKQTIEYFVDLFSTVNQGGGLWKTIFDKMAYGVAFMAFEVKDLVRVMGSWGDAYSAILEGRWGDLDKIAAKRMQEREADEARLIALDKQLSAPSTAPSPWDNAPTTLPRRPGQTDGPKRAVTVGIDKEAEAARRRAEADARRLAHEAEMAAKRQFDLEKKGREVAAQQREDDLRAIALQEQMYAEGGAAMQEQQRLQNIQLERAQELFMLEHRGINLTKEDLQFERDYLELTYKHKDAIESINANKNLDTEERARAIAKENELFEKGTDLAKQRNKIIKDEEAAQRTFSYGWNKAFDDYKKSAENAAIDGAKAFQTFSKGMENAIDSFVETGKLSFSNLAESIIKDLLKIQLKKQALALWDTGSVAVSSAGGVMGLVSAGLKLFGFADGGSPPVGVPSMVGERGPELFIPKTAGTIIPNNILQGSGGQTINYNGPYIANMSAIDTQSGAQFLAKNKQAVWATYQSANRSVPMSR